MSELFNNYSNHFVVLKGLLLFTRQTVKISLWEKLKVISKSCRANCLAVYMQGKNFFSDFNLPFYMAIKYEVQWSKQYFSLHS